MLGASSEDSVGVGVGGLETWLLINLVNIVSVATSTRDSHRVRDCSPPLLNASKLKSKQTGAPRS